MDSIASLIVLIRDWSLSALLSWSSVWQVTVFRSDSNLRIPLFPFFSMYHPLLSSVSDFRI